MQVYMYVSSKKNHMYFCLFGVYLVAVQIHTLKQKFCMVIFLVVCFEVLSCTCVDGIVIMRQKKKVFARTLNIQIFYHVCNEAFQGLQHKLNRPEILSVYSLVIIT